MINATDSHPTAQHSQALRLFFHQSVEARIAWHVEAAQVAVARQPLPGPLSARLGRLAA